MVFFSALHQCFAALSVRGIHGKAVIVLLSFFNLGIAQQDIGFDAPYAAALAGIAVDGHGRFAVRERVEACINEHTRALFVTNPGNPTGSILTPEELKLMLDIAKEHDLFIICDEVYREFVYAGEPLLSDVREWKDKIHFPDLDLLGFLFPKCR